MHAAVWKDELALLPDDSADVASDLARTRAGKHLSPIPCRITDA